MCSFPPSGLQLDSFSIRLFINASLCLQRVLFLELWRWCFFGSGLAPVWFISDFVVHCVLVSLEAKLFTVHQALYFAVAMKVRTPCLLERAAISGRIIG